MNQRNQTLNETRVLSPGRVRRASLVLALLALLLGLAAEMVQAQQHVIVRTALPDRGFGWPANGGIWSWGNEILVMYCSGQFDPQAGCSNHDVKQTSGATWDTSRSLDGGVTWTDHRTAFPWYRVSDPQGVTPTTLTTPIDFSNPNTIITFKWDDLGTGGRSYLYYSTNKGTNWHGPYNNMGLFGKNAVLGRTCYEVTGANSLTAYLPMVDNNETGCYRESSYRVLTSDGGVSWTLGSRISKSLAACGSTATLYDSFPAVARVNANTLVGAFRSGSSKSGGGRHGWINVTRSTDNGATWTSVNEGTLAYMDTLNSTPPGLSRLPNGRLALSWGYRLPDDCSAPTRIQAATSDDNGSTWSPVINLRTNGFDYDIGYVQSVVRADGRVVSVYYWRNWGGGVVPNHIAATIWDAGGGGVTPPAAPSSLTATAVSSSQINLAWTDNATNEEGFKIERKTGAGGAWGEIATVTANVTSYQNTGLTQGTTYFYRVRAYNAQGDSAYSNEASATPTGSSGLLDVTVSADRPNNPGELKVNLTTEGTADWMRFDRTSNAPIAQLLVRKASVVPRIGQPYAINTTRAATYNDNSSTWYNWTDGTPVPAGTNDRDGWFYMDKDDPGNGVGIGIPLTADPQERIARIYVGRWGSGGRMSIWLSDGSAPGYTNSAPMGWLSDRTYTIRYRAVSAGQTLNVTWRCQGTPGADEGNVNIQAITVQETAPPPPPAAPSNLTATAASSSQINLAWTDNANNEDGFKIERKTGVGGTWAQIETVGAGVTAYQNTGLTHQTTYYYRVRAYNAGGDSDYSNEANATTFALTPPAAPSSLTATAVSATRINLAWTDNATNEAGFKIERKTGVGGTWAEVAAAGVNGTTFANTGLTPKTTYYYRVAATNSAGASAWSNEAQATTLEADPLPDVCLPKTGQTQSSTAGDDGDLQQGVAWPNPRFTDNGNGTVTDNLTGLIWLKKADNAVMTWTNALIFCNDLAEGTSGLTDGSAAGDWRMPNINELRSLWNLGRNNPTLPDPHPFTGVQNAGYWSSTPRINSTEIITVNFGNGTSGAATRTSTLRVLAVRGSGCVPKTGRTQADAAGSDGMVQAGVAWPSPRFTDNGDGTVTDHLTGLVWTKNANPLGNLAWTNAVTQCRNLASGSGGLSDGSVAGDWRLPNVNELRSLLNYGVASGPALPAGHPFTGVVNGTYWSSTRRPVLQGPLNVNFSTGAASDGSATTATAVWPVRDGAGSPPVPVAARFVGIEWLANGVLQLSATGGVSQTYILEGTTNLVPPVVWQPVHTNTAVGGAVQLTDPGATNHPQRYYRAVTP